MRSDGDTCWSNSLSLCLLINSLGSAAEGVGAAGGGAGAEEPVMEAMICWSGLLDGPTPGGWRRPETADIAAAGTVAWPSDEEEADEEEDRWVVRKDEDVEDEAGR